MQVAANTALMPNMFIKVLLLMPIFAVPSAFAAEPKKVSSSMAILKAGVIASLRTCEGKWCRADVGGRVEKEALWGTE